jgi:hypothetical protein
MAPTQKNTARGRDIQRELDEALDKFGITPDRINFETSKRHFRGECPDIYEDFLKRFDIDRCTLILHDGGNAFKRKKVSIFESLGFANHEQYPSDVHQYLSPNDNKLHACKVTWYNEYNKFENDVEAPLRLMQLIDREAEKNSRKYFDDNILRVKKSQVAEIIRR